MKTLYDKTLSLIACISAFILAAPAAADAQTTSPIEEKVLPVGEFSVVSVSDDFEVTLVKGAYNVRLTTDKALTPYVQVYVRSKVLYINYDEKAVPKEVKSQYKGKNASVPVFRAVVSLPELNGIDLSGNATLTTTEEFDGGVFNLTMQDKAQIKNLKLNASSVQLNLKKNSLANLNLTAAQKAEIYAEGSANLKAAIETAELTVSTANSAVVTLNGSSSILSLSAVGSSKISASERNDSCTMKLGGSAEVNIEGESETLLLNAEKNAVLDASNYATKTVEAEMSGGKANVKVSDELSLSLSGGSALYYVGTPVFKIGKVLKSTLAAYGSSGK